MRKTGEETFSKCYKASVCGHFALGKDKLNGQTIKSKIVRAELVRRFGQKSIHTIDTSGFANIILLPFQIFCALWQSENIVIMPAHKGVVIVSFFLALFRLLFPFRRKTHYVVIGGWLHLKLRSNSFLKHCIRRGIDHVYCETTTMYKALSEFQLGNVCVMPNCKNLQIIQIDENTLKADKGETIKLCTFSRVMKQKGIEDIVNAVTAVNNARQSVCYVLDIYGQIDRNETEWFANLQKTFPAFVSYKGEIPFSESVNTLRNYDALVFPTRFYTEGVPGTIIDAYASALPVISAAWESCNDVVTDGVTGYLYPLGDESSLVKWLERICDNPRLLSSLKGNCIKRAEAFLPQNVIDILVKNF